MKKRLTELIFEKAFKYSEEPIFKLVSGRMSNYYFNCKAVTLHPEGMYLIGNLIYEMIKIQALKPSEASRSAQTLLRMPSHTHLI